MTWSKSLKYLAILFIGVFFLHLLCAGWIRGGRWDLNEQIAFAFRLIDGHSGYTNGGTDLFIPSSPYFPGVGILSALFIMLGARGVN